MKYIFKFPDIGEGLDEGIIVEWLVKKGQEVKVGDNLVTMETDKVVTEIPSPKNGIISQLYGKVGDTIHVGDALVEIEIEGQESSDNDTTDSTTEAVKEEGAGVVGTLEVAGNSAVMKASSEGQAPKPTDKQIKKALATPVARAMAKDFGIDINRVTGTGPAGRVMKSDILNFKQGNTKKDIVTEVLDHFPEKNESRVEIEPLTQIRKTIAQNMSRSKHNAAHMGLFDDVEISELTRIREKYKNEYADKGIKITYLPFILKAVAAALKKHKALNAELDLEGGKIVYKKYYNISIAVDTPRGLVVPVIKDVDKLNILEIAEALHIITEKAEKNQFTLDDFKDGSFSVTSYGSIGGKYGFPVINYPQVAILGVGRIFEQPIVKNGEIGIGKMLPLSMSVDHRIVDGAEVSRFMNDILEYLSDPVKLLIN